MPTITGRNCKVEVALTYDGSALAPTAVTKADPPSVTLTSHGLVDGDVGYWTITDGGMVELNEQACYVDQSSTSVFTLPGLVSTNYGTYAAGTFLRVATWGTLTEAAGYTVGGGEANPLDDPRLLDSKLRQVTGFLSPDNLTIDVSNQEVDGTALIFIQKAARAQSSVLFRISKASRVLLVAYGVPGAPGSSVRAGQLGTGSFNVIVPAFALKPNHA